jgi:hypothetical protein
MNATAIIILLVLLGAIFGAGFYVWSRTRKLLREAKNIERGLKMVPMLIHLPPSSDDIDVGGRDARDVNEETISKAQILYDIIVSTSKDGFKSKFYGQRHVTFEIVASRGMVQYYVAVPVALVDVVQQAIISAYPTARLEQVAEHNIFSPVGKISGTIGGELNLKEDYVYPIATYQESKRDAMNSILNALSTLGNEDGAGIQILLRPAQKGWEKRSQSEVSKQRKNKGKKSGLGLGAKDFASAIWKPPETGEAKPEDKQLTGLEQAHLDAIEDKTRHSAYEVLIRVVASSNTAHKSQTILNNIVATFALFDAPGKNGFKFSAAHDIESFSTAYIMRMFPPEQNQNVLNSVELATIFHFPDQRSTPTSQLERQSFKQVDGPRNMPENGTLMGYNVFRGVKKEVRLSDDDRRRHLYIVGQTGTGKSVFLENMALQDMLAGKGFAFIDPHGDTADTLMSMVPKERTEDIVYFSPGDMDFPLGLNLFEFDQNHPEQKDFLVQEAISMLYKLYDPQHQGIIGPRYEHWFRNAALTVMAGPEPGSFIDIPKVFTDDAYMKNKLQYVTEQPVLDFWNKEMAQTSDYHKSEVLGWFVSKFGAFMTNEMMRNTIGQTKSAFDLREIMDNKKILLVNLSKGKSGELNSKLLGMIFVMKFQAAAMSRANIPESQRVDFSLYVDEFQNFSTESFATILSEARKYRLNLIVANQYISQLSDEVREAVFGNVGSLITLRAGASDADALIKQFTPTFDVEDLIKIPNHNAIVRLMVGGVPSQPFSMATIPPLGHANLELGAALKRLSAAKYGRPKQIVADEINKRLASPPDKPKLAPGARPGATSTGSFGYKPPTPGGAKTPGAAGGSSFLDEWLAKRKQQGKALPPAPGAKSPARPAATNAPVGLPQKPATPTVKSEPKPLINQSQTPKTPVKQDATPPADIPKPIQDPTTLKINQAKKPKAQPVLKAADLEKGSATLKFGASAKTQPQKLSDDEEANLADKVEETLKSQLGGQDLGSSKPLNTGYITDDEEQSADEIYIDKDGNIHQAAVKED